MIATKLHINRTSVEDWGKWQQLQKDFAHKMVHECLIQEI